MTDWFPASKRTVLIDKCEEISFGCVMPKEVTILSENVCCKSSSENLGLRLDGCCLPMFCNSLPVQSLPTVS